MKIRFFVRYKGKKPKIDFEKTTPLYVRISDKGVVDQKAKTNVVVPVGLWNNKKNTIDTGVIMPVDKRLDILSRVAKIEAFVRYQYSAKVDLIEKKWLSRTLAELYTQPAKEHGNLSILDFSQMFEKFLAEHTVGSTQRHLSPKRKEQYRVVARMILRYELYVSQHSNCAYKFDVRKITSETLYSLYDYAAREDKIFVEEPSIFQSIPEKRPPKPRCKNTLFDIFNKKIKCFVHWLLQQKYLKDDPFLDFKIDPEMYGSIYFLEWEELENIRKKDFSAFPKTELAKDHLLVQAGIGCRVGDLMRLEKSNYYGGFMHYIPNKGIDTNPETVSVPVVDFAAEVLKKYKDVPGPYLLPPIREQEYNEQIRHILTMCRITRNVTFLDPATRKEVTRPINEVFSSHDLRRTFINKVFQVTKGNTALTSSMTGHKSAEAFKRYREVSDDLKLKTLKNLNLK